MSIFSRLFGSREKAVQRAEPDNYRWGGGIDPILEFMLGGGKTVSPHQALEWYSQSSTVSTVIDLIVSKAELVRPVVRDTKGELSDDAEILKFLKHPNDYETYRQFIGSLMRHWLLTNNFFVLQSGVLENRPPKEIYCLNPSGTTPISNDGTPYPHEYSVAGVMGQGTYKAQQENSRVRFIREAGDWELCHLKGFTTRQDSMLGDSPLEGVMQEIKQHAAGNVHNLSMLTNGARLSLLFAIKEDMSPEMFKVAEEALIKRFGGGKKAGAVGVVAASEMDVHEMGVNNKDMDFVELMEATRGAIISRYNVPLPLVLAARQTLSNYSEAIDALYYEAVIPLLNVVFDGLTRHLMPRFGYEPGAEALTYDANEIEPIRRRRMEELKTKSDLNVLTVNEKRAEISGLDTIDGGDVVLGPSTLVPIAGSGIDPAAMMQEDREAEEEARALTEEETRNNMRNQNNEGNSKAEAGG